MSYYLPTLLITAVGLSNELARLLTAVNLVTYFIFSCASIPLVERWGRRGLMPVSTAGQGLARGWPSGRSRSSSDMEAHPIATEKQPRAPLSSSSSSTLRLGSACWASRGFTLPRSTPSPCERRVPRCLLRPTGKTKDGGSRGIGRPNRASPRITNFIIVQIKPIGIQNISWKFWIVFTVLNATFIPVIYLFYPEACKS